MKKIISIALCVALLAGTLAVGLGSFPLGLKAAADEYSDAYKSIVENTPVPAEFTAKDDPYGYGVNVPFTLNTKEELLHIKTFGSSASFTSYDNLTAKNSTTYPESGATATSVGNISNKLSHIQTVAFDANGNGKKDHVAVIGVNMQKNVEGGSNDYGAIYMYVFDKSGRQSNVLKLGNARWLGSNYILNNDNMYDFNAMNFFGVTAGDYNGDDHENCDSEYVSDVTPSVAHNFTSKVIKNTCCSEGYTIKYCADCGFSVIEDETDAKGHKFEVTNVFAPTCSTTGYSIYTCSECGVNYIDDITETTAHTPGEWVCEDPATGRYVKRCENCYKLLDTKTVSIVGSNGDGEGEGSEGSGGSNSLNPNIDENGVLNIGYQETEKVTLKADGIDTSTVVYTSSDPKVATVDEDGNITAVGPGDAVITASIPGTAITTSVPVNVKLTWWQKIHYILNTSALFRIIFVIFKIPAFDGLPL